MLVVASFKRWHYCCLLRPLPFENNLNLYWFLLAKAWDVNKDNAEKDTYSELRLLPFGFSHLSNVFMLFHSAIMNIQC